MISRLTACAATFAILATASLAFAANSVRHDAPMPKSAVQATPVIQLDTVVVIGKRAAAQQSF